MKPEHDLLPLETTKPSTGLTAKEHATRAMLMDRRYCRPVHAYMKLTLQEGYWLASTALDADTLEPFKRGDITSRFRKLGRGTTRFHVGDANYEDE